MKRAVVFWIAGMAAFSACTARGQGTEPANRPQEVDALVAGLAADKFQVREDSTYKLWELGDTALEALKVAAASEDPEVAYRAQGLVRKIEHHITPDTDPTVIALVERYMKADRDDKPQILSKIRERRGYHQFLKLYATETDEVLKSSLSAEAHGVAIIAAREKLVEGKPEDARRFLEMSPRDAQSLMSLAAFHRGQGTLAAELEKEKRSPDPAWRAAIYRAMGDAGRAREAATEAGDATLMAYMALFEGDPLLWLTLRQNGENPWATSQYLSIVTNLWKGRPITPAALEPLAKALKGQDEERKLAAANVAMLLGEPALVEPFFLKMDYARLKVEYLEGLDRIPEVFKVLGVDPEKKDFREWAAKRFELVMRDEEGAAGAREELVELAGTAERLGISDELSPIYAAPLLKMAEQDEDFFLQFMAEIFGSVKLARDVGARWAGDDPAKWRSLAKVAFQENEMTLELWDWTSALKPDAGPAERFDGLVALLGFSTDPDGLGRRWLDLAWEAYGRGGEADKSVILRRIDAAVNPEKGITLGNMPLTGDVETFLKVWDLMKPEDRHERMYSMAVRSLAAAGRWQEVAETFENLIERNRSGPQLFLLAHHHAYAAAARRKCGQEREAAEHDAWVEKLALGDWTAAQEFATQYSFGGDEKRAAMWTLRAAMEVPPEVDRIDAMDEIIGACAQRFLEEGKWRPAAALGEAKALMASGVEFPNMAPRPLLLARLKADLPLALSLLPADRARAVAMLDRCHAYMPSGGTLADDFFPSVRRAGLLKEHARWFASSWDTLTSQISAYPASHNLRNNIGWMGGRAVMRLEESRTHMEEALRLNPEQGTYLDTMAEICFAERDRKAALKWSSRAVNFLVIDPQIRRQYDRFSTAPFP